MRSLCVEMPMARTLPARLALRSTSQSSRIGPVAAGLGGGSADAAAAQKNPAFGPPVAHGQSQGLGDVRVVGWLQAVRSQVKRFVSQFAQQHFYAFLEFESRVVRSERNFHKGMS